MSRELTVHATHQGGMHFMAKTRDHVVHVDYPLEEGDQVAGFTSLELLLASLATCCGNTLAVVLRQMRREFDGIAVTARGSRRDEHPTVLTGIELEIAVRGSAPDQETAERALGIAEAQLCPVWAMLRPGTPITTSVRVAADQPPPSHAA
jgi:uncharacterized OsmC-like protein